MAGLFSRLMSGQGLLGESKAAPGGGLLSDGSSQMMVAAPNILDLALSEARKRYYDPSTVDHPFNDVQNMVPAAVSVPGRAPDASGLDALKPYLDALGPSPEDKRRALFSSIADAGAGISNARGTYGGLGAALSQGLAAGNEGYDRSLASARETNMNRLETALKLRKSVSPELAEYGLNPQVGINPATGKPEFFVTDKYGRPKFLGVGERAKAPITWTVPNGRKETTFIMGDDGGPIAIGTKSLDAPPTPSLQLVQGPDGGYYIVDPRNPGKPASPVMGPDGGPLLKPAAGSANAPAEFNKASTGLLELKKSLQNYRDTLARLGSNRVMPGSKEATDLNSAYTAMQMGVKNAMELGALTGSDEQILNNFLTPPVSVGGMLIGPEGINTQLNQADSYLKNRQSAVEETYGRKVGGVQQPAPPVVAPPKAPARPAVPGKRPPLNDIFGGQ